ncbi:hypothetical protein D3C85_1525240 [compost metagenome]
MRANELTALARYGIFQRPPQGRSIELPGCKLYRMSVIAHLNLRIDGDRIRLERDQCRAAFARLGVRGYDKYAVE